jgi:hypothetical protein
VTVKIFKIVFFILLIIASNNNAQSFGFGCLGFVGGYGGFSFQKYNPKGLNNYVDSYNLQFKDSLSSPMAKFGKAQGYRVGLNFFRANFKGIILTTKGFYQFLSENNSSSIIGSAGNINTNFEVDFKNWGVGLDLGTDISQALSWKVVDAAILFNTSSFTNTTNTPGPLTTVLQYNSEKSSIGYSVGTGFILQIIDEYISLEGVAAYTTFTIGKMRSTNGTELTSSVSSSEAMDNFVTAGGFNAVVQLNIGFPL